MSRPNYADPRPARRAVAARELLLLLAALAHLGCASTPTPDVHSLPFRVALAPTDVAPFDLPEEDASSKRLAFTLEPKGLTEQIAEQLRLRHFDEVVELTGETDDWLSAAQNERADLLMTSRVDYSPSARPRINDRFFLNLPLFFLGGPACWFVNDRSYEYEAHVRVEFHDVQLSSTWPAAPGSELATVQDHDRVATLDFLDRARGPVPYFVSVVVPAGLLAKSSDAAGESLSERVTVQLAERLALQIEKWHSQLLSAAGHFPYDVVGWTVVETDEGLRFEGTVDVLLDLGAQVLGPCKIVSGDDELCEVQPVGESRGTVQGRNVLRTTVRATFQAPEGVSSVQLALEDAEGRRRTFTIDLSDTNARTIALTAGSESKAINVLKTPVADTFRPRGARAVAERAP
ncbi:MAG: hypothetical protein GY711_22950 [bacterium]|nr:hypothetical protein [bacterium]